MNQKVELLAPAGSVETMLAAFNAGADAVYIGGSRFGARAFADNADQTQLLEAIDYAHLHGKKLYLTVNTLLKEEELERGLYEYLLPYYRQGLDAAIVQDLGVLRKLREWFPDLHLHASTQMTVTGALSAKKLQELGVVRLVTPRELSLQEIRQIHESSSLEIESFVHGALCYCYSGQCLFSSIVGGRSGNRGRCAQPCRMAYTVEQQGRVILPEDRGYILSPRDLCTIELLPQIIEAGVYSLKIEGRMKKPEYTAGVVSIYRKYLDRYLERGSKGYQVMREDKNHLLGLFNRKGFTDGYYTRHNGSSMITYTAPDFRTGEEDYLQELRIRYIGKKLKENIKGTVKIIQGKPAILSVSCGRQGVQESVSAGLVQPAKTKPLEEAAIRRQLEKLGDTDFVWTGLEVETDGQSFCPVGVLNELRRTAVGQLRESILKKFRRELSPEDSDIYKAARDRELQLKAEVHGMSEEAVQQPREAVWDVSVETQEQLEAALEHDWIGQITVDCHLCEAEDYSRLAEQVHAANKTCFLMLPRVFRQENEAAWIKQQTLIQGAGFDGFLAGVAEAYLFAERYLLPGRVAVDHSLYSWNKEAAGELSRWGCLYCTLPLELNRSELGAVAGPDSELFVYGRIPMMVSAQCICSNVTGCSRKPQIFTLKDRMGNRFPVKNICKECYNVIYNSLPLSLADQWKSVSSLEVRGWRLCFTTEDREETERVLALYGDLARYGATNRKLEHITRGHYKRGTE